MPANHLDAFMTALLSVFALLLATNFTGSDSDHGGGHVAATSSVDSVVAARPVIIVLHGRGMRADDSTAFRKDLLHWMRESARAATGSPLLRDDDVRLVWYADLVAANTAAPRCESPPDQPTDTTLAPFAALAAFAGSLFELTEVDSSAGSRELRSMVRDVRYFADPALRCAADRRVGNALAAAAAEKRPVVLVAYSFGGLLAWHHLHTRAMSSKSPVIRRLVTVGSPVASPFVRQVVFADSRAVATLPRGVSSWVNIVDSADPFAASIAPDSSVKASAGTSDLVLVTGRTNPHDLRGYLEHRATVDAIVGAWCNASASPESSCKTFVTR